MNTTKQTEKMVILVGGEEPFRAELAGRLARAGYQVRGCADGREAAAGLLPGQPCIIFLDCGPCASAVER